jgi:sugar lactone lactonase YvrE
MNRIWENDAASAVYDVLDVEGRHARDSTSQLLDDTTTSNGLGWLPDSSVLYYTDSIARTIWAFDLSACIAGSQLSGERLHGESEFGEGS